MNILLPYKVNPNNITVINNNYTRIEYEKLFNYNGIIDFPLKCDFKKLLYKYYLIITFNCDNNELYLVLTDDWDETLSQIGISACGGYEFHLYHIILNTDNTLQIMLNPIGMDDKRYSINKNKYYKMEIFDGLLYKIQMYMLVSY